MASSITSVTGIVAAGETLPVLVLMEIAAGLHGDFAGEPDVVVGDEFAGF